MSKEHPVVISKFIENAREVELDAVACKGKVVVHAISEHIEEAGVHSGDASLVLPTVRLEPEIAERIYEAGCKIAEALNISGPFNSQFIVGADGSIKVIECNVRASRSLPFVSKTLGVNFIELATEVFTGHDVQPVNIDLSRIPYTGVKVPQFSFARLLGADPVLGVEMASTGEVACLGADMNEAFIKAMLASNFRLPKKNILIMAGDRQDEFLPSARALAAMGYNLFATPVTAAHLAKNGVAVTRLPMPRTDEYLADPHQPDVLHAIRNHKVDVFFTFPKGTSQGQDPNSEEQRRSYRVRRAAVDHNIPVITNIKVAAQLVEAMATTSQLETVSYQQHRADAAAMPEMVAETKSTSKDSTPKA